MIEMLTPKYEVLETMPGYKQLVVRFNIDNGQVLSDFLMSDVTDFEERIKSFFDQVLMGVVERWEFGGNLFDVVVEPHQTIIQNQFLDSAVCIVATQELYLTILEWCEKYRDFRASNR